jgi:hypothetical protein
MTRSHRLVISHREGGVAMTATPFLARSRWQSGAAAYKATGVLAEPGMRDGGDGDHATDADREYYD